MMEGSSKEICENTSDTQQDDPLKIRDTQESEEGEQPAKKLRIEEEEASSTVEKTSLTNISSPKPESNGSSTSTKVMVGTEGESKEQSENLQDATDEQTQNQNIGEEKDKTSEGGKETSGDNSEMDETTSKLLASGISISLIKRKKPSEEVTPTPVSSECKEGETTPNPLEVGPNISVTMVNRQPPAQSPTPKGITVRSDLMGSMGSTGDKGPDLKSTISMSKVSQGLAESVPGGGQPKQQPPLMKMQRPPGPMGYGMGGPRGGMGLPRGGMMGGPRGGMLVGPRGGHPINPMMNQGQHHMPGLQPRPNGPGLQSNLPLASGSVAEQLTAVAGGLADYMRSGLEELLRDLSAQGSPEATITGLKLEMEKMAWRHSQEMAEMKQQVDIMVKDMKSSLEKEQQRCIEQVKKQAEVEKQKAVIETKKKQWCAACTKEAIFYCCWNTSYCDYPCQQSHWPTHMSSCSQSSSPESETTTGQAEPAVSGGGGLPGGAPPPGIPTMPNMPRPMGNMPGFNMPSNMPNMGSVRPSLPGHVSIRPGIPGQFTISRPYFM